MPLRKRVDDIPLLIENFLDGSSKTISPRALEILKRYQWPGNVRELQNTVERFKILAEGDVIAEGDIPANIKTPGAQTDPFESNDTFLLSAIEKKHILRVLAHFNGNKTKAATAMGITVKTLYNKLALYDREQPELTQG
jgi:DNA-binding NtrC family response regulator